jgi:Formate hydrogenlyase subunit 6/NADH:ubiquinone oxidoreductase 23 kD subunit (chain I)
MSIDAYYFSGTGNSLAVAKEIAEKTEGTLISISSVIDMPTIKTGADSIGIVFPCYLAQLFGIPLIVERFVRKLEGIGSKYVFAVATCGGRVSVNALPTLKNLGKIIKSLGGRLAAEFSINLPMNNLEYISIQHQDHEKMFERCQIKIEEICWCVTAKVKNGHRIRQSLFNMLITPMNAMLQHFYVEHLKKMAKENENTRLGFRELIYLSDKSIYVDDSCNGCETCVKVCPVRNIAMIAGRPVWQHHCEMCMACDEWCPQRAIHHWNKTKGHDYHHPTVKIADMLTQARRRTG